MNNWDSSCDAAFEEPKKEILTDPVLSEHWNITLICNVDVSKYADGGTLTHVGADRVEILVALFSMNPSNSGQEFTENER